uniref:C2H2-type domain-containing protein n=1 Tax=Latimeria chalumnae TaxID=7897 RepID=H2ZYI4_LATCH
FHDNMKATVQFDGSISDSFEMKTGDRNRWCQCLHQGIKVHDRNWLQRLEEKRVCGKQAAPELPNHDTYTCNHCHRSCKSRIGLFSHMRYCKPS